MSCGFEEEGVEFHLSTSRDESGKGVDITPFFLKLERGHKGLERQLRRSGEGRRVCVGRKWEWDLDGESSIL